MTDAAASSFPLVAVDIGNSRIKFGLFETPPQRGEFPAPAKSASLGPDLSPRDLEDWLNDAAAPRSWLIASVQRTTAARLMERLGSRPTRLLERADLPVIVDMPKPEQVGIDRLANAVAANQLRQPDRGAIVIAVGTAIVVDAIACDGTFLGGAILPGIGMSARALHEFTDLLPLSEMTELLDAPDPLGKDTIGALRSGLFWGAVGAMRELTTRLGVRLSRPQVFLTGGTAPSVSDYVSDETGERAHYVPHLTLAGIALSAADT